MRAIGIVVAVIVAGSSLWLAREIREGRRVRKSTAIAVKSGETSSADLRERTKVQTVRADAAEREIARLKAAQSGPAAPAALPSLPADFQDQLKAISQVSAAGRHQESLDALLKLYAQVKGLKERERVALDICVLAMSKGYAPALAAAHELRDQAWRDLRANPDHPFLPGEIALISLRLEEGVQMLPVWDFLPNGDPRRGGLQPYIQPPMIAARRYAEALEIKPFARLLSDLESGFRRVASLSEAAQASQNTRMIADAVRGIEALAGAGKPEELAMLTQKLIGYDGSDATRQLIQESVQRAAK